MTLSGLMKRFSVASVMLVCVMQTQATFQSIEYFAGTGPNVSFVVIDFYVTGGTTRTFGYCYEEPVNSFEMLEAIAEAGPLEFDYTVEPFGVFVDNFTYLDETGDSSQYWRFETAQAGQGAFVWETSGAGVTQRMISDRSVDGWYNSFIDLSKPGFGGRDAEPFEVSGAVPEPQTGLIVGVMVVLGLIIPRRRIAERVCNV